MKKLSWTLLLIVSLLGLGCGGGGTVEKPPEKSPVPGGGTEPGPAPTPTPAEKTYDTTIPMVTYQWDPQAGDATVPAEMGGPGFTGEGWTTNMTFPSIGSAEAKRGGQMTLYEPDWPATLRQMGKDWNTQFNYMVADLCNAGLLTIHPTTLDFIPSLATHWQISEDKMTYRFRINPKARYSDGSEVTADDWVATYKIRMDPTLLEPSDILTFGKLHPPVAVSKYIVEVKVKEENWRNFLYFSSMAVFPAKEISIKGSEYLDKYQNSYTANPGPYIVKPEEFDMGNSLFIRRRTDWWDEGNPAWTGMYNIETYKMVVVKDPPLVFEKAKKGEIDFYVVPKAQWWAEEIPKLETVQRGLLQPVKIYNDHAIGFSGIACNSTKPPLDDVRMRKTLGHLYNRKLMIEKLYFNEYLPLQSYYQGGIYQNPGNAPVEYDELEAVRLLEEMGYKEKNADGYRTKDGAELKLTINYASPLSERSLTIFQESCKKAGIKLELQILTPAAQWKNLTQKEYELADVAWGALIFPNPETSFHSKLADQKDNNNVTAYKNPEVDKLCEAYDKEYDPQKRIELVRQIDGLIYKDTPYVLGWYLPSLRILYWNKFSMPAWGTGRTMDDYQAHYVWWVDPEKEKALEAAKADATKTMPAGEKENRFWPAYAKAQAGTATP